MFWAVILVMVVIVIGLSVAAGAVLNRASRRHRRANPRDPMTALKASGALKHRKSNRP